MRCMYSKQIRAAGDAKVEVGLLSSLRKEDDDNDGLEVSNHPVSREEVVHHMVVIRWKTASWVLVLGRLGTSPSRPKPSALYFV